MSNIILARDLRAGQTIIWNNEPHLVLDHSFNKTAMRGGIVKCKIKNLLTKSITTEDLSNKKLTQAVINKYDVIFSYCTDSDLIFMDKNTFEEIKINKKGYEWEIYFLEEGLELKLNYYEGQIISLILPEITTLTIKELLEENSSSEQKKAVTKNGLIVLVPKFFTIDKKLTVSTEDGKYKSR